MVPLGDLAALNTPEAARRATPSGTTALLPLPGAFVVAVFLLLLGVFGRCRGRFGVEFLGRATGAALQTRQVRVECRRAGWRRCERWAPRASSRGCFYRSKTLQRNAFSKHSGRERTTSIQEGATRQEPCGAGNKQAVQVTRTPRVVYRQFSSDKSHLGKALRHLHAFVARHAAGGALVVQSSALLVGLDRVFALRGGRGHRGRLVEGHHRLGHGDGRGRRLVVLAAVVVISAGALYLGGCRGGFGVALGGCRGGFSVDLVIRLGLRGTT